MCGTRRNLWSRQMITMEDLFRVWCGRQGLSAYNVVVSTFKIYVIVWNPVNVCDGLVPFFFQI